jgi:hypothetical protein
MPAKRAGTLRHQRDYGVCKRAAGKPGTGKMVQFLCRPHEVPYGSSSARGSSQDVSFRVWQGAGACCLDPRNHFPHALAVTVAILMDPFPECQLLGARSSEFGLGLQRSTSVPTIGPSPKPNSEDLAPLTF